MFKYLKSDRIINQTTTQLTSCVFCVSLTVCRWLLDPQKLFFCFVFLLYFFPRTVRMFACFGLQKVQIGEYIHEHTHTHTHYSSMVYNIVFTILYIVTFIGYDQPRVGYAMKFISTFYSLISTTNIVGTHTRILFYTYPDVIEAT